VEDDDYEDDDEFDPGLDDDFSMFQDPGGTSALRKETPDNPRIHPCPSCKSPNRLTPADVSLGYQCDTCADRAEQGW
jgi:hypothetical protein